MKTKTCKILILLPLLLILALSFQPISSAHASGYLAGYNFRKSQVIGSATGAGSNYQVKFIVHYGAGADSGQDVYCSSLCKTDFSDIRWTKSDGTSPFDYYIESYTSSVSALFWVEIADSLESSSVTVFMYFGNSGASSASNGANTFLFYDPFSALSGWTARSGSWTISSGALKSAGNDGDQLVTTSFTVENARMRLSGQTQSSGGNVGIDFLMRTADVNNLYRAEYWNSYSGTDYLDGGKRVASTWGAYTTYSGAKTITADFNWHIMEMCWYGTSGKSTLDDSATLLWTATDSSLSGANPIGFRYGGSSSYFLIDWVFVAKYTSPEPSPGAWGSLEGLIHSYVLRYTTGGSLYYNSSNSAPVVKPANGSTTLIPQGQNFILYGLADAGKIFVKFVLNSTDNTTGNPLTTNAILGNGTIWAIFQTPIVLQGNATINQVLSGNTFMNQTGGPYTGVAVASDNDLTSLFIILAIIAIVVAVVAFASRS